MVKLRSFLLFFLFIGVSFTVIAQDNSIFIEGTASNAQHHRFFLDSFRMEGSASGYDIVDTRADAAFVFRFEVARNMITYIDGTQEPAPPDEDQYIIQISLIDNSTGAEQVAFGFSFSEIDAMNEYTQFLFLRAALNIAQEQGNFVQINDDWLKKRLYVLLSVDYPITFFELKPRGLFLGTSVYDGDIETPSDFTPIDNRTTRFPAVTLGLQVQLHNWFSVEPNFQVIMGDDTRFFTMEAGLKLMVPLKMINNVVLLPYGAVSFPLRKSPDFSRFPLFAYGGGLQVGIRGGNRGMIFVDFNFMNSFRDAVLKNPYGVMYPNPEGIHFSRRAIGIGIGYKFGFLDL